VFGVLIAFGVGVGNAADEDAIAVGVEEIVAFWIGT